MLAYEILTATDAEVDFFTTEDLARERSRLIDLTQLGLTEICGLSIEWGIMRLDKESARRADYAAELEAELARYDGDFTAMLLARFGS